MKVALIIEENTDYDLVWDSDSFKRFASRLSREQPILVFASRQRRKECLEFGYPKCVLYPFQKRTYHRVSLSYSAPICFDILKDSKCSSIYLYGAGSHTKQLLDLWNNRGSLPIKSILVSEDSGLREFASYPVHQVGRIHLEPEKDIVIFSSESFESEMFQTFQEHYAGVDCMGFYHFSNGSLRDTLESKYLDMFECVVADRDEEIKKWVSAHQPELLICSKKENQGLLQSLQEVAEQVVFYDDSGTICFPEIDYEPQLIQNRKRKWLYVDQSQRDQIGHYYQYGRNVLTAASEVFHTYLACNQLMEASVSHADQVIPAFRFDIWGKDPLSHEVPPEILSSKDFAFRLNRIIEELDLSENDHVFIPNISDSELEALLEYVPNFCDRRFVLSLFFRYDLPRDSLRISLLNKMTDLFPTVRYYTDTEALRQAHVRTGQIEMSILPIPVAAFSKDIQARSSAGDSLTITYLGDARVEKGFHLLPDLIERFHTDNPDTSHKFEIQGYTNGCDSIVKHTINKLKELQSIYPLIVHFSPLTKEAYLDLLDRADVLLCLYDKEVYRYRSSHIFTEALCHGKELVVTDGCSSSTQLEVGCPWIAESRESAHVALNWIVQNRTESRAMSQFYERRFAQESTGEMLVKSIVESFAHGS